MNCNHEVVILPEFLTFRRIISPVLLQFIFWPTVIIGIYYNNWLIVEAGYHMHWWTLISGIMLLRLAFECLFVYTFLRRTDY